jgi:hypothetical protein
VVGWVVLFGAAYLLAHKSSSAPPAKAVSSPTLAVGKPVPSGTNVLSTGSTSSTPTSGHADVTAAAAIPPLPGLRKPVVRAASAPAVTRTVVRSAPVVTAPVTSSRGSTVVATRPVTSTGGGSTSSSQGGGTSSSGSGTSGSKGGSGTGSGTVSGGGSGTGTTSGGG